jgi:hypothetical protein
MQRTPGRRRAASWSGGATSAERDRRPTLRRSSRGRSILLQRCPAPARAIRRTDWGATAGVQSLRMCRLRFEHAWAHSQGGLPREARLGEAGYGNEEGRRDARRWPTALEHENRDTPPPGGEPERRRDERRMRRQAGQPEKRAQGQRQRQDQRQQTARAPPRSRTPDTAIGHSGGHGPRRLGKPAELCPLNHPGPLVRRSPHTDRKYVAGRRIRTPETSSPKRRPKWVTSPVRRCVAPTATAARRIGRSFSGSTSSPGTCVESMAMETSTSTSRFSSRSL